MSKKNVEIYEEMETGKKENAQPVHFSGRNRVLLGALTVLLGIAGYINFSGNGLKLGKGERATDTDTVFSESEENLYAENGANEPEIFEFEQDGYFDLNSDTDKIGEAVLTSADVKGSNTVALRLNREQTRSKSKEYYLEIMNGESMDEAAVASATDAYVKLTENMEKENEAETMLLAKGFEDVLVSISDASVDVVVRAETLSAEERAQIEDVIVRKTGYRVDQIIISTMP